MTEKNNYYLLTVASVEELKKYDMKTAYNEVMKRENRVGLPRIVVEAGKHWIMGTICKSNIGYDFRGQMSTNLYPQIQSNMTFYEMLKQED